MKTLKLNLLLHLKKYPVVKLGEAVYSVFESVAPASSLLFDNTCTWYCRVTGINFHCPTACFVTPNATASFDGLPKYSIASSLVMGIVNHSLPRKVNHDL
jgi:hypothetical protein